MHRRIFNGIFVLLRSDKMLTIRFYCGQNLDGHSGLDEHATYPTVLGIYLSHESVRLHWGCLSVFSMLDFRGRIEVKIGFPGILAQNDTILDIFRPNTLESALIRKQKKQWHISLDWRSQPPWMMQLSGNPSVASVNFQLLVKPMSATLKSASQIVDRHFLGVHVASPLDNTFYRGAFKHCFHASYAYLTKFSGYS